MANPYQLHSTLCRAFSPPETKCTKGEFLWRLEPETDSSGNPRILVQSRKLPDWNGITVKGWLAEADAAINLKERLKLDSLKAGQHFRFRLRANPCVTRNGKRLGLLKQEDQEKWLERQAQQHGFLLPQLLSFDYSESSEERPDVRISQEQMLCDKQHTNNSIRVFSVLYDGMLTVTEPEAFTKALQGGIGHGKVMGLGMLSVVPVA
ncbi:MAG: type I-E CRISPR-associated protein Cas6/Cse3/CasE [Desulfuromonadales bacterium]